MPRTTPDDPPGEGRSLSRALRVARKVAISAFIVWHVTALFFWNLPRGEFPCDQRIADLPRWFIDGEMRLYRWKHDLEDHMYAPHDAQEWLAGALSTYIIRTATWQNWWMFAPNPINIDRYITVKAVIGYGPGHDADHNPQYVYDPQPFYTSYRGYLGESRMGRPKSGPGSASAASGDFTDDELQRFGGSYTPDHKFVENLTLGDWDYATWLGQFDRWCFQQYNAMPEHRAHPAREMHVILHEYRIPGAWEGRSVADAPMTERVFWWYKP
jgi:hypothetical protein